MHYLPPIPKQFVNINGVPLTNGSLHVFLHGKPDYASVWAEAETDRQVENPVQLESNGAWVAFLDSNVPYDIVVYDKLGFVQFSYVNVVIPVVDKEYVDESVGAVQAQLDHVSDSVEANTESIVENAEAIAENSRSIDENTTAISENSTAIAANTASIAANTSEISRHERDRNNPHHVTAHQVGAYTQQETEDRISDAISGEVGGWLGNLTVAEVNALTTHKKGDSATLLDAGTVMPGNVTVDVGDDIMWVDSLGVWQPKITDHLHHDETLMGTGSASDPLGVNLEVVENNVLRMRYANTNTLRFYRGVLIL